jgi:hypothetical protein
VCRLSSGRSALAVQPWLFGSVGIRPWWGQKVSFQLLM